MEQPPGPFGPDPFTKYPGKKPKIQGTVTALGYNSILTWKDDDIIISNHVFELDKQPNEKQRKSYKNENRFILPNALTIQRKRNIQPQLIQNASVLVGLCFENGEQLDAMSYIEGELVQTIDKHSGKAHFSLKMLEVSEPRKFRLFFDVKYFIYENAHYDRIITFPFMVSSNRKKFLIEQPLVFKINPTQGMCNEETEVWIKGLAFTERGTTHITFGGKSAKISETDDNLLMCYAPPIGNIEEDLVVLVEVMNTHPNKGELIATYKPLFTYLSEERPTNRTKDEMPQIFIPPSFQSSPNMPDFNDGHGSISGSKQSD